MFSAARGGILKPSTIGLRKAEDFSQVLFFFFWGLLVPKALENAHCKLSVGQGGLIQDHSSPGPRGEPFWGRGGLDLLGFALWFFGFRQQVPMKATASSGGEGHLGATRNSWTSAERTWPGLPTSFLKLCPTVSIFSSTFLSYGAFLLYNEKKIDFFFRKENRSRISS